MARMGQRNNRPEPRHTQDHLEKLAKDILDYAGLNQFPVDVDFLATIEGIDIIGMERFRDADVSGAIRKNGDEVMILVKESDIEQRKRFTIAHELGHYYLHLQDGNGNFVDDNVSLFRHPDTLDYREVEANWFAAALLMPKLLVEEEWEYSGDVGEMARKFKVSKPAMEIRLESLGLGK